MLFVNCAAVGGTTNIIPYEEMGEKCSPPNSVSLSLSSPYRCQPSSECIPLLQNNDINSLPDANSNDPVRLLGRCVEPCSEDCSNGAQNLQCGTDGRTYYNSCYRTCANIQVR